MRALPFVLLWTSACAPGLLGPEFGQRFDHLSGCGDVIFFAVDTRDEVMLTFTADGLLAAAREAGMETTTVVSFPSDDVELKVEQGSRISDATCDDVVVGRGPSVQRTWTPVSGTATMTLRPLDELTGGRGDLVLEELVFEADGTVVELGRLEWVDISVGWFAG